MTSGVTGVPPEVTPLVAMSTRARSRTVFRRDGEYWTVVYGDVTCHLRDTRGLQLLAVLLRRPGDWVPAGELLACVIEGCGSGAEGVVRERVRVHATQAMKAALRKLTQQMPALGEHLAVTVRTGNRCAYLPDPRVPIAWETGSPNACLLGRAPTPSPGGAGRKKH